MSDDGRGQNAREQPTELSQSVKEGPVVGFHAGALNVNASYRLSQFKKNGILFPQR